VTTKIQTKIAVVAAAEEEYEERRKIIDPEVGDVLYTREAPPGIAVYVDRKKSVSVRG
jgi:hypothetical protein